MRPVPKWLLGIAVTRFASRSLPRAMLVGGGIIAKALFDRRKSKKAAKSADGDGVN